jgi:hypothetical protein
MLCNVNIFMMADPAHSCSHVSMKMTALIVSFDWFGSSYYLYDSTTEMTFHSHQLSSLRELTACITASLALRLLLSRRSCQCITALGSCWRIGWYDVLHIVLLI